MTICRAVCSLGPTSNIGNFRMNPRRSLPRALDRTKLGRRRVNRCFPGKLLLRVVAKAPRPNGLDELDAGHSSLQSTVRR
jgi:hypothetical protein